MTQFPWVQIIIWVVGIIGAAGGAYWFLMKTIYENRQDAQDKNISQLEDELKQVKTEHQIAIKDLEAEFNEKIFNTHRTFDKKFEDITKEIQKIHELEKTHAANSTDIEWLKKGQQK